MAENDQIAITLVGSKPPIRRRIRAPASRKLYQPRGILRMMISRADSRMRAFSVGARSDGVVVLEMEMTDEG